jgi:hypothetical protein
MKAEAATGNSDGATPVEEEWAIKKNPPIDK